METRSSADDPFVGAAFLERVLADKAAGGAKELAEYQSLFPGHEAQIAREFTALAQDATLPSPSTSPATTPESTSASTSESDTLHAFRDRYRRDQAEGVDRALHAYLTLFPGRDESVAREFIRLQEASTGKWPLTASDTVGPYEIGRELGHGGQGAVYLATDRRLGRRVALKVISHLGADAGASLERFQREAVVASRLNHPGICKVHDSGLHGRFAYIAMELVEGETLARRVQAARRGARPDQRRTPDEPDDESSVPGRGEVKQILRIIEQAARALDAAHGAGVIHRDIKPGNIMITPSDQPVILDFGLARQVEGDLRTLTQTGDFFGTPAYMAPELLTADRLRPDHRADIWGLGICLHECLTLRRPFYEPTREKLYQAILTREPPDVRRLNPAVPHDLKVIVDTALAKEPDQRYRSAEALADDLLAVLEGRPISARAVSLPGRVTRWARRRPAAAALAAALVLGLPALSILTGVIIAKYPSWAAHERDETRRQHEAMLAEALDRLLQWNFDQAIPVFRAGLDAHPDSVEALGGLALAHLRARDPAAALGELERKKTLVEQSSSLTRIRADALDELDRGNTPPTPVENSTSPRDHTDCFLLGLRALIRRELSREHSAKEAFTFFTLADELYPHEPRVIYYFCRAFAAISEGDFSHRVTARRIARVMEQRWPDHHLTWYALGAALRDDAVAIQHLERCVTERPDFVLAYARLSFRLVLVNPRKALEYADLALARAPAWPWTHAVRARAFRYLEEYDDAIAEIEEGIQKNPADPALRVQLGRIWIAQRDWSRAAAVFRAAIPINPDYYGAHSWLGYALMMEKRHDEALAAFRAALALAPDEPWTLVQLGRTLRAQGHRDVALDKFSAAIRLEPEHVAAFRFRALLRLERGDFRGAEADCERILTLRPGDSRAIAALSRIRAERDKGQAKPR